MSENTAHHESHEYHSHAKQYVRIWGILLTLLIVSILGPMLEIPILTLITAFGIALVKASLVVKYFMHLDHEPKFIWYILSVSLAFMCLFFFAVAPDVKNHTGTNWTNIAAIAEIERGEAYGDPAAHHGDHGGEHGGEHGTPEEHGTENHGGAHEGGH
ncbi:MAG: cytochrome C oxidase subunit IV family protein [Alphaproteobacteria bacterium]|nr:cytochrome C oxidase subunit IV family protein [Alphaproteobacteria bacterium]